MYSLFSSENFPPPKEGLESTTKFENLSEKMRNLSKLFLFCMSLIPSNYIQFRIPPLSGKIHISGVDN